jgi:hypothetical protein
VMGELVFSSLGFGCNWTGRGSKGAAIGLSRASLYCNERVRRTPTDMVMDLDGVVVGWVSCKSRSSPVGLPQLVNAKRLAFVMSAWTYAGGKTSEQLEFKANGWSTIESQGGGGIYQRWLPISTLDLA